MGRFSHPEASRRHSSRLKEYDYSLPGAYFITICTQHRDLLFGDILDGSLHPSPAGEMISEWWQELNHKFAPVVATDAFIIMPNHVHGIIINSGARAITQGWASTQDRPYALGDIVAWFKTMTTNAYFRGVKQQRWPAVDKRLWQRNYHDRVIRNEREAARLRAYIEHNPAGWRNDKNHPDWKTLVRERGTLV